MIGRLFAMLAGSARARTALRYSVRALAILLFLLALRRSGEWAGRQGTGRPSRWIKAQVLGRHAFLACAKFTEH